MSPASIDKSLMILFWSLAESPLGTRYTEIVLAAESSFVKNIDVVAESLVLV